MGNWQDCSPRTFVNFTYPTAKCIDTYIALSVSRDSTTSKLSAEQTPSELNNAFSTANGSAGGLTSPTAPFSQSALPSKSLLSREESVEEFEQSPAGKSPLSAGLLSAPTQKALQAVIRRIFEKCFQEGQYHEVVGIAVEARNLDILRETIMRAGEHTTYSRRLRGEDKNERIEEIMDYLLDICLNVVQERVLRNEVLSSIPSYL